MRKKWKAGSYLWRKPGNGTLIKYSWFSADIISLCKLGFRHVGAHARCEIESKSDQLYYRVSIDTSDRHLDRPPIDTRSTLGWHTVDISVDRLKFLWHSIEWRSILAMIIRSMSVDVSVATLRSAVSSMSVVYQWYIGGMSGTYSSQYPFPNGPMLPNTPSASVTSKIQLFLVIFCANKIKLLWRQSFMRAISHGSIFDWCWWFLIRKMALPFPSCRKEGQWYYFATFASRGRLVGKCTVIHVVSQLTSS